MKAKKAYLFYFKRTDCLTILLLNKDEVILGPIDEKDRKQHWYSSKGCAVMFSVVSAISGLWGNDSYCDSIEADNLGRIL